MTDSSDATVMNPGKGEQGQHHKRGPYHLHVGHRPEAGHVDVRFDFCHGACRTRRRAGRGAERGRAPTRGLRAAGARELSSASRFSPSPLPLSPPPLCIRAATLSPPGSSPLPRSRRAPPPPRRGGSFPLYLQIPAGACCRSRPTACRGCEWCFPSRGLPRRPGPPAPSRCCGRGESCRQRPASARPPDPLPSGRVGQERRPGDPSLAAPCWRDALGSGAMGSLTSQRRRPKRWAKPCLRSARGRSGALGSVTWSKFGRSSFPCRPAAPPGEDAEPGWLGPVPAALGRSLPVLGGRGWLWLCAPSGSAAAQPDVTASMGELGFEGTVRGRRAVTIIE